MTTLLQTQTKGHDLSGRVVDMRLTGSKTVDPAAHITPDSTPRAANTKLTDDAAPYDDQCAASAASKLIFQFLILNTIAFVLLGVALVTGYLTPVFQADQTRLCVLIFAVFVVGLLICAQKVLKTSREQASVAQSTPVEDSMAARYLQQVESGDATGRQLAASTLRLQVSHGISITRHIANALVILGLIGTVIGFIIALSGVDPEIASDVNAIAPMVSTLIAGMSTALYTTLIGAVLNVWLMANHQLLLSGSVQFITSLIQRGEYHARV